METAIRTGALGFPEFAHAPFPVPDRKLPLLPLLTPPDFMLFIDPRKP